MDEQALYDAGFDTDRQRRIELLGYLQTLNLFVEVVSEGCDVSASIPAMLEDLAKMEELIKKGV